MAERDTTTLFTQALNVMNAALAKHKDSMPYEALIKGAEKLLKDRNLGVAVYESDPGSPFDYFTVRFSEGAIEMVSHGKEEPDVAWKVSRDYLEKVVENDQDYIDNPAKLDWDWLKSRAGVES